MSIVLDPVQCAADTQARHGGVDLSPTGANHDAIPRGSVPRSDSPAPDTTPRSTPMPEAPRVHGSLAEAELRILAESLTDFERVRIATENRLRSLRQVYEIDESIETPEIVRLTSTLDGLRALEHTAELDLGRALRNHPLGPWVKATVGIGAKQGARLIAAIGDPAWNSLHDRPRTVSELWAYCGYHVLRTGQASLDAHPRSAGADPSSDPGHRRAVTQRPVAGVAPSHHRGQKANWNAEAKMRAFLCAESCIKQAHSPYRQVYDDGRAKYIDATHATECRRCGPSGKPAPVGSDLSDGHKHARAMRLVTKAILKDMWRAAS